MAWFDITPSKRFLCCLPLSVGVKALLYLMLVECVYTTCMAVLVVTTNSTGLQENESDWVEMWTAVWSLIGIPIVLGALWGLDNKGDIQMRLYFNYLVICWVVDTASIVRTLIQTDPCSQPQIAELQGQSGAAFACGVARAVSWSWAFILESALLYLIYIVWSLTLEFEGSGSAKMISSLLEYADGLPPRVRGLAAALARAFQGAGLAGSKGADEYSSLKRGIV